MTDYSPSFLVLDHNNNHKIAYRQLKKNSNLPSILLLGGFGSNMYGEKATALYNYCNKHNLNLTVFDYLGHGHSSGNFTDYTIGDWYKNCISVIESLTNGPQIIIGSSMGGWLMLLIAQSYPHKVISLLGLAPAPDFTENLIFNKLTQEQKDCLHTNNQIIFTFNKYEDRSYDITDNLIKDGRKHLLLNNDNININCPVILIHSMSDLVVPYSTSIHVAEKITSTNVNLHLIKSGNHYLRDEHSLNVTFSAIQSLLAQC
ncbi:alpha/beta hydrolase [Candidatus Neoehrlichia procyonis]|uniref:Prolyl oligopeptidase family protein n=1 Tax=Candidatus Neoehrlichia procyonis str. RAC413 TaxID=1359163 RepID=A0A0F3NN81_9RICK|nr:alpha/beta hydrolase [Candidatus Neoehrlichia lotoris]KJV69137.1 prolyl oligopeptidase family protein [Candidatus Neoehrlichia lotoris str. RAC413]